ncbi:late competence development ComFB family protein [Leptolyngbya sp. AN02str]|uniref:late competence development ComFB family protein n=1 Tax=Leptolyngbya sp. AN02str TaxID=3423363 RepID=UPI003D321FFB
MQIYKNVMEVLVEQEIDRQLNAIPQRNAVRVNKLELTAYALNQLPSLYATSQRGLQYQLQVGRAKFSPQITQAVQRAIAAVHRDPIRSSAPLKLKEPPVIQGVMGQIRKLLNNDQLSWESLPSVLETMLSSANSRAAASATSTVAATPSSIRRPGSAYTKASSPFPQMSPPANPSAPSPAAARERLRAHGYRPSATNSARPATPPPSQPNPSAWDDPFFR